MRWGSVEYGRQYLGDFITSLNGAGSYIEGERERDRCVYEAPVQVGLVDYTPVMEWTLFTGDQ